MIPILGALLGGGLSNVAESIIGGIVNKGAEEAKDYVKDKIKDITGLDIDPEATELPKDAMNKLTAEEAKLEEAKEEHRHLEKMKEKEIEQDILKAEQEYYKLDAEDRANARDLNKDYLKSNDKFISRFQPVLGLFVLFIALTLVITVFTVDIPPEKKDLVYIIATSILTQMSMVLSYYFGSSHGSQNKDKVAEELEKAAMKK